MTTKTNTGGHITSSALHFESTELFWLFPDKSEWRKQRELMGCFPWRWKNLLSGCPSEVKESVTTAVLLLFKFNTGPQEKNTAQMTFDPAGFGNGQQQQIPSSRCYVIYSFYYLINTCLLWVCVCVSAEKWKMLRFITFNRQRKELKPKWWW